MKTLKQINKDIDTELKATEKEEREKVLNKSRKRIEFLRICAKYLEHDPTEAFVQYEIERVFKRMQSINDGFRAYMQQILVTNSQPDEKKEKATYRRINEYSLYSNQLKTLRFINSNR